MTMARPCPPHCWLKTYRLASTPPSRSKIDNARPSSSSTRLHSLPHLPRSQTPLLALHTDHADGPVVATLVPSVLLNSGALVFGSGNKAARRVSYTALTGSFGGGDDGGVGSVAINGVTVQVSQHLETALKEMRYSGVDHYLWVDAMGWGRGSVESVEDRLGGAQQNVIKAYTAAERCVVWLGGEAERYRSTWSPEEKAMLFLGEFDTGEVHSEDCAEGMAAVCFGMGMLARRPWWDKAWVRPEIFASPEVIVRVGDIYMPFTKLRQNANAALKMIEKFKVRHEPLANNVSVSGVHALVEVVNRVRGIAPVDSV